MRRNGAKKRSGCCLGGRLVLSKDKNAVTVLSLHRHGRSDHGPPEMRNHWEMGSASGVVLGRSDVDGVQVVMMDGRMGWGDGDVVGWKSMGLGVIARLDRSPRFGHICKAALCAVRTRSPQNAPLTPVSLSPLAKVIHPATVHASRSSKVRTSAASAL
jgi:hypothetical protein